MAAPFTTSQTGARPRQPDGADGAGPGAPRYGASRADQGDRRPFSYPGEASQPDITPDDLPFGPGQHHAEAELYADLDRFHGSRTSGFPPFDALSARLGEFSPPAEGMEVRSAPMPNDASTSRLELDWFEKRFDQIEDTLRGRVIERDEIRALHDRINTLIDRVERRATAQRSNGEIEGVSRAAREILKAAEEIKSVGAGLGAVTQSYGRDFNSAVAATAAEVAALTATHIETALVRSLPQRSLGRMEVELRSLNVQSRETGDRMTEALDRVHDTLRQFLPSDPRPATQPAASEKKRVSVATPIGSDVHDYSRVSPVTKGETRSQPLLSKLAARDIKDKSSAPPMGGNAQHEFRARSAPDFLQNRQPKPQPTPASAVRRDYDTAGGHTDRKYDEERAFPILGISLVAFVLIIASVAMYYLHASGKSLSKRSSIRTDQVARVDLPASVQPPVAVPFARLLPSAQQRPSLLSATQAYNQSGERVPEPLENVNKLLARASEGDPQAEFRVAVRLLNHETAEGKGAAARWLSRSADHGHLEGMFVLATLLERGAGVGRDDLRAIALYRKAALEGHSQAMHNLAVMLGRTTSDTDRPEAAKWFRLAAAKGLPASQYNLAVISEGGIGVPRNVGRAYFWFSLAAATGDTEARFQAERVERELTVSETRAIQEEVKAWRPSPQSWAVN